MFRFCETAIILFNYSHCSSLVLLTILRHCHPCSVGCSLNSEWNMPSLRHANGSPLDCIDWSETTPFIKTVFYSQISYYFLVLRTIYLCFSLCFLFINNTLTLIELARIVLNSKLSAKENLYKDRGIISTQNISNRAMSYAQVTLCLRRNVRHFWVISGVQREHLAYKFHFLCEYVITPHCGVFALVSWSK